VILLLGTKFGPLAPGVRERVDALSPDELRQVQLAVLEAQSLKELRLED
jgi:hypothetical protein